MHFFFFFFSGYISESQNRQTERHQSSSVSWCPQSPSVLGTWALLNVLLIASCNIAISPGSHSSSLWKTCAREAQRSARARRSDGWPAPCFFGEAEPNSRHCNSSEQWIANLLAVSPCESDDRGVALGRAEHMGSGWVLGWLMRGSREEARRLRWIDELCYQDGHWSVTPAVLIDLWSRPTG